MSGRAQRSYPAKRAILQVETLRDFTTTWRVLPISGLAIVIGVGAAYVAVFPAVPAGLLSAARGGALSSPRFG